MDIIIFAAITVFIFLKLRKQLGQIDEEEKKRIEENIAKKKAEMMAMQQQVKQAESAMRIVNPQVQIGEKISQAQNSVEEKIFEHLDQQSKQNFQNILNSCRISPDFFVNGARSSFEMVIKAFAEADLETLKMLLSEKIYQGFEAAINQRKAQQETLVTNIIAVNKVEIISALVIENIASIVVKFVSKQINYITDNSGAVTKGRKDEIHEITDIWTFQKNLSSQGPDWLVSATHK